MTLRSMHEGVIGKLTKFLILGMLGAAVVSMALMDGGSIFRSNVNATDVARIENKRISIQTFDMIFRNQLSRYGINSPQEAYEDGTLRAILANEVRANFVELETEKFGLYADKEKIQKRIAEMVAPHVKEEQTMQQTLDIILKQQNMSEPTFIKGVAREIAADVVTSSVKSAFPPVQKNLLKDLFLFQNQTRDVEILTFKNDSVKDIKPATDEQLIELYEKQKSTIYAVPELRTFKILVPDAEKISKSVSITDEEVKKDYEDHKDTFIEAKKTILSQIITKDKAAANKILELVNKGEDFKTVSEKILKEDGQFFEKIPFDDQLMIPQIETALKDKPVGSFVGPIETQLGIHIVRLDAYEDERPQTFDEVKETIRQEMLNTKIMDSLFEKSQSLDELIAGGAVPEEISKEIPLKTFDITAVTRFGQNEREENAVTALPEFLQQDANQLFETAFNTPAGEISRIMELPSGNFAAVNVITVKETTPKKFEDIKQKIADAFLADQKAATNKERATAAVKDLKEKKITLANLAKRENLEIKSQQKILLNGMLEKPLTDEQRALIFKTPIGDYDSFNTEDGIAILHINSYGLPDFSEMKKEQANQMETALNEEIRGEAFAMYLERLSGRYIAVINEPLLKQAYAPKQTESE